MEQVKTLIKSMRKGRKKMANNILLVSNELELIKQTGFWEYIIIPIAIVSLISFLIGLERQNIGKSAGISPHVLIGVSSAVIAVIQRYLWLDGGVVQENQRLIAQILPGIGFIGAGVIMKGDKTIVGLTTAATIWTCAVVGLVVGSGYIIIGGIFGVGVLLFIYIRDIKRGINPFKQHVHYDFGETDFDEDERKRHA